MAPRFSKSTRKRNPLVSPMQSLRSYWRRHAPRREHCHLAAHGLLWRPLSFSFVWAGSFCRAGFEPSLCPRAKDYFPISVTGPRPLMIILPRLLGSLCSRPVLVVAESLSPGLDGCFRQDHFRFPGNVLNSSDVLRCARRWKVRTSSFPAQEAASLTCRHLRRGCQFAPGTHVAYWVGPRRARDHANIN